MSRKTIVMIGFTVGTLAGGYVPMLFGADLFSFTPIIGNAIGGALGIYIAYKLTV